MKKIITNFHDVSAYIKLNSKKTYRECAVVLMCTFLLCTSGAMTDSNNAYENKKVTQVSMVTNEGAKSDKTDYQEQVLYKDVPIPKLVLDSYQPSGSISAKNDKNIFLDSFKTTEQMKEEQISNLNQASVTSDDTTDLEEMTDTERVPEEAIIVVENTEFEEETVASTNVENITAQSEEIGISENVVSQNMISEIAISENVVSENMISEIVVSENVVSEIATSVISVDESVVTEIVDTVQNESTAGIAVPNGMSPSEYDSLCRIVEAEAGTEGEEGKLLVANVVLNRVASPAFPNSIEAVVTQSSNGKVQFSPVANGSYASAIATPETLNAVNRALSGENNSMGALFFKSVHSNASWDNRTLLFNYGNHNFYI